MSAAPLRAAAEHLRTLRLAADLSQEGLAERSGVSERTIRTLEAGRALRPHRDTLLSLAAGLGLPSAAWEAFVASWRQQTLGLAELVSGPGPQDALLAEFARQRSLMTDLAIAESTRIGADGRMVDAVHRRTFQVAGDGLDRFFTLQGFPAGDIRWDRLQMVDCRNFVVGAVVDIPDWSARAWECRFDRWLQVGSVHTIQWRQDYLPALADVPATSSTARRCSA